MCQDQRLLQPAGGRTLCRAASVYSPPPPSHLIEYMEPGYTRAQDLVLAIIVMQLHCIATS